MFGGTSKFLDHRHIVKLALSDNQESNGPALSEGGESNGALRQSGPDFRRPRQNELDPIISTLLYANQELIGE